MTAASRPVSACQQAAVSGRAQHPRASRSEHPSWGAPKIRDKLIRRVPDDQAAGRQHDPRRARSQWPRQTTQTPPLQGPRHRAHRRARAQRSLVRRLQGRVHARQQAVLLSAHHHRLPLPLPARLRRPRVDALGVRLLPYSSAPSRTSACRTPSAPTTARRSLRGLALFGLVPLAVWWLRLGIRIQRIKPGQPQQNGRHERMHLTLKKETTKPAAFNFLQQQERFDHFIRVYNHERPHQALGGAYPAEMYTPSARRYQPPQDPEYPFHDRTVRVTRCGRICLGSRKINLSKVFAGQWWASAKSTTRSGWSASWSTIWDSSIGMRTASNPRPIPLPQTVLTMCPE